MNKIKQFFKKNDLKLYVGTSTFIFIGVICFGITAYINHWNVLEYLVSKQALLVYALVFAFFLMLLKFIWQGHIEREDNEDE